MVNFNEFLEVIKQCNIKTGYDFEQFMAVIDEHCLQKGITDFKSIQKVWDEHIQSLKRVVNNIKQKNL